jgi:hypothetical protein
LENDEEMKAISDAAIRALIANQVAWSVLHAILRTLPNKEELEEEIKKSCDELLGQAIENGGSELQINIMTGYANAAIEAIRNK